jgi:hypothetical protein
VVAELRTLIEVVAESRVDFAGIGRDPPAGRVVESMEIKVLESRDGDVIARELIDDEAHGEFYVLPSGQVRYRYLEAGYDLFANADVNRFMAAVRAWHRYCVAARDATEGAAERQVVEALKVDLEGAGSGLDMDGSFWAAIFEQVEDGML